MTTHRARRGALLAVCVVKECGAVCQSVLSDVRRLIPAQHSLIVNNARQRVLSCQTQITCFLHAPTVNCFTLTEYCER